MNSHSALDAALLQRVHGEFLEMPGLRLTCQQAQRLWGLDERTCLRLLEFLVEAKFLCRTGHGMYARLTDGDGASAQPRMAKAQIDHDTPPIQETDGEYLIKADLPVVKKEDVSGRVA